MSAETLRRAAAQMRREHGTDAFYGAVADWLDEVGRSAEKVHAEVPEMWWGNQALAVAQAYLWESA